MYTSKYFRRNSQGRREIKNEASSENVGEEKRLHARHFNSHHTPRTHTGDRFVNFHTKEVAICAKTHRLLDVETSVQKRCTAAEKTTKFSRYTFITSTGWRIINIMIYLTNNIFLSDFI